MIICCCFLFYTSPITLIVSGWYRFRFHFMLIFTRKVSCQWIEKTTWIADPLYYALNSLNYYYTQNMIKKKIKVFISPFENLLWNELETILIHRIKKRWIFSQTRISLKRLIDVQKNTHSRGILTLYKDLFLYSTKENIKFRGDYFHFNFI